MKKQVLSLFLAIVLCVQLSGCMFLDLSGNVPEKKGAAHDGSIFAAESTIEETEYQYDGAAGDLSLYCYSHLKPEYREIYLAICEAVENFRPELRGPIFCSKYLFDTILKAVEADHPEYFWVNLRNSDCLYSHVGRRPAVMRYRFQYLLPEEKVRAYQSLIATENDKILAGINPDFSEYEVVKYLHDTILDRVSYDDSAYEDKRSHFCNKGQYTVPEEYHSAFSILGFYTRDTFVCAGYAKLFQYLLSKVGVWSTYVTGRSRDEGHAWNIVQLDGEYYQFDLTWDDPSTEKGEPDLMQYDYFGVSTEEISRDHTIETEILKSPYPECTAGKYNYHRYNGLYFEKYDYAQFYRAIEKAVSEKQANVPFRFATAEIGKECLDILFENERIFDLFADLPYSPPYSSLDRHRVSHTYNEDQYILTVWFVYQ